MYNIIKSYVGDKQEGAETTLRNNKLWLFYCLAFLLLKKIVYHS